MTDAVQDRDEHALAAKLDWERRIYRRLTDTTEADPSSRLDPPGELTATAAAGHVHLRWAPVPGAAGYLIERTDPDGRTHLLDHGGSDVPAVPGVEFADTGLQDGARYSYRVAAVAGADLPAWDWSDAADGQTSGRTAEPLTLTIDADAVVDRLQRVWWMAGSERLTQLRFGDDSNGNQIGAEFAHALSVARDDLGVRAVRAHAIFHDDNKVVHRAADGTLQFDFTEIDLLYDQVLGLGIRPVVELSFMPAAMARDPEQTVFGYRGIISPPADWAQWHALVAALAGHLVQRYGIDEVAGWGFEVWNEPNLEVFWAGTQEEYFRLYDESAAAVKSVDPRLLIGGPSTAAAEWITALVAHTNEVGIPLDFISSHTYGNLPLDTRPAVAPASGVGDRVWWTEWGVGSTHFGPVHDSVAGAPFVLMGYRAVQHRMQALAYWVVSDHFEELGRAKSLFHNGFGLLSIGNLRKPRYWAALLAAQQGDEVLSAELSGDGAEVLVQAWATRDPDGVIDLLIWNGTINSEMMHGDSRLDRTVEVRLDALPAAEYRVELNRVDADHSNVVAALPPDVRWPDSDQWERLRAADVLHSELLPTLSADRGTGQLTVTLPQPGVVRLRLSPIVERPGEL
jgi:xylan 1,4-beta-xylosidase